MIAALIFGIPQRLTFGMSTFWYNNMKHTFSFYPTSLKKEWENYVEEVKSAVTSSNI